MGVSGVLPWVLGIVTLWNSAYVSALPSGEVLIMQGPRCLGSNKVIGNSKDKVADLEVCAGDATQKWMYMPQTQEIRQGTEACLAIGGDHEVGHLYRCDGKDNQKYSYDEKTKQFKQGGQCLAIGGKHGVAYLTTCSSSETQVFDLKPLVNECLTNNGGCHDLTKCIDTVTGRECSKCPAGYEGTGEEGCTDLNECITNNGGCDRMTTCTNIPGGRTCGPCPTGYSGSGDTGCTDINECATNNGGCDKLSQCTNIPGSRTCGLCPAGYDGTGLTACVDMDECSLNNGGCDILSKCINKPGTRECGPCPAGYSGNGEKGCVDNDECLQNNGGCDALTQCINTRGSRTCGPCPRGYRGTGVSACIDEDECKVNNGGCDELTKCTNTPGNFTCGRCPEGYTGDGYTGCTKTKEGAEETIKEMAGRIGEEQARAVAEKIRLQKLEHDAMMQEQMERQRKQDRIKELQDKAAMLTKVLDEEENKRDVTNKYTEQTERARINLDRYKKLRSLTEGAHASAKSMYDNHPSNPENQQESSKAAVGTF